ncbi:MAG: hypothetical protein Q4B68_01030 [Bacteroidales bacterium]|nr:hypothetical protein [Bacteroidales bacterium]
MKKILSIALALCAIMLTSCVKDEVYPYASVSGLANTDAFSQADDVTVTAKVSALVGIADVQLRYTINGKDAKTVTMVPANGGYAGVIPGQPKGTKVEYCVIATTEAGKTTTSATNSYEVGKVPVNYTGLVLNELNGNDKFIELYNGGDHAIYIGEVKMFKDSNFDAATWTGTEKNLQPGEYIVLTSEDVAPAEMEPSLVFHSGLSAKKSVRITIQGPDGKVIDDFNLNNDAGTKYAGSFGRNADGKWYHQTTKTPGAKNVDGTEALTMK